MIITFQILTHEKALKGRNIITRGNALGNKYHKFNCSTLCCSNERECCMEQELQELIYKTHFYHSILHHLFFC